MLELFVAILIGLCMISGVLLRYTPFAAIITPKQKHVLYIVYAAVGLGNVLLMTILFHFFGLTIAIDYLQIGGTAYAVLLSLANIYVIRGKNREHLFVLGIVLSYHYLMLSVPVYLLSLMPGLHALQSLLVFLGIYGGVLLLTYWPFVGLLCNTIEPFLHMDTGNYWNTICFIPLAYFTAMTTFRWSTDTVDSALQLISGLFSGAIMIFMCMSITADHKRLHERQVMQKQLESQKVHYAELKVRVEEARKAKHDFKHHIAVIRHYTDIDDKEGLCSYCDELVERTDGQGTIPYTGNAAADGVLYHYMQRAQQEHIHFRYSGVIHSQGIADMDLCALLGNALDNAFTACLTIPQGRSIAVISQSDKQLVSIVIHNTFDGIVEQSAEGLLSRKRENSCGVGISSMRSICERYGGSMETRWDEKNFTIMFILPLTPEQ